jgi:hypothetical protein
MTARAQSDDEENARAHDDDDSSTRAGAFDATSA